MWRGGGGGGGGDWNLNTVLYKHNKCISLPYVVFYINNGNKLFRWLKFIVIYEQQECKKVFPGEAKITAILSLTRLSGLISLAECSKESSLL